MTDPATRHPRVLSALTIVRDRSEFSHRSAIRSIALLNVIQDRDEGARFALHHHVFDRATPRAAILEGLAERVPRDATLIARAPRILKHALRLIKATGQPMAPADLQLLQKLRDDLEILPLECRSAALDEIGAAFALRRAGPGSSLLAQSRKAPEEAQCLWLSFLWTVCSRTDRTALTSAWQAWSALQRARPIPF
jgi:hypothetical protein